MKPSHISTFLNLVLRHKPHLFNVQVDENGWVDVHELIAIINERDVPLTITLLKEIVATTPNQGFTFNEDRSRIRANQGQHIKIDFAFNQQHPPQILYHVTENKFLSSIKKGGLDKIGRQHVHLSADERTAIKVTAKKGRSVILIIDAAKMQKDGFLFYLSQNGVWLTDHVPVAYIRF
jgi:putative RNA 2'-phosphotransferase